MHNLNVSIEQCLLFHVSVHNVSFTETNLIRCRDVIMTILNTNLGLSQISPQRMYQFDCVIFMINSFLFNSPTSPIYSFIPLIYHIFIFIPRSHTRIFLTTPYGSPNRSQSQASVNNTLRSVYNSSQLGDIRNEPWKQRQIF